MSYLSDFEELNGGYVAFGGNPKGGKISGKGKIRTGKLDFDDVYFVKELKFNLFSVSQMCDKKNSVLFTDTECLVLSPDFKLPDESQVLLRVPRETICTMTIIEAARTMLADSLLPIPFWAEAVNTACYVQNRVLVTKPHNKTLYELLHGSTPSIGFMRPFSCLVTILNTLDSLGFQAKFDAEKAGEEIEQQYVLFLVWYSGFTNPQNTDRDAAFDEKEHEFEGSKPESEVNVSPSSKFEDFFDDNINEVNVAGTLVSAAGPSNAAASLTHGKSSYDVGAEADFKNLETSITVSPIPTTRVHKVHHVTQIIDRKSASTPIDTEKPLQKDPDGEDVDVHTYRLMIGSLMHLTSSRPDIMFAYLKDSPFNLVAYSDSDYAGPSLDRKSTTEGCQFLRRRLISWQSKKQTVVATSSTEAEYVAATSFYAQVLWIQNQLLDYGAVSTNLGIHQNSNDSPFLGVNTPRCDEDRLELMELTVFLLLKVEKVAVEVSDVDLQFWTTVAVKKVNDVTRLQALVDKKKVVVTEATIRDALHLDDAKGIECLPNEEIFAELARMGYEKPSTKLTFYKAFFQASGSFDSHHTATLVRNVDSPTKFYMYPRFPQLMIRKQVGDLSTHTTKYTSPALTQKVFANMRRVGKGFFGVETSLFEGMIMEQNVAEGDVVNVTGVVTEGVVSAVNDEDKVAQDLEITKLKSRVNKLERRNKASKLKRLTKVISAQRIDTSDDTVIDDDVTVEKSADVQDNADIQGRTAESQAEIYKINLDHANKVLSMQEEELEPFKMQEVVDIVTTAKIIMKVVIAASTTITIDVVPIPAATTTATLTLNASPSRRTEGVVIMDPKEATTTSTIIHSEAKSKDKAGYTCSNLEKTKKCSWSSKSQELEAVGILWCADNYIYNNTVDFASREEISTHKESKDPQNKLSLPKLSPTCMTLELAGRSISRPVGVAEDVYVKTRRAFIDVFEGELTLRIGKEAISFNLDQTSRYSANYNDMTANQIDVIDMACEEYSQEVLGFSDVIAKVDAFLALEDDPTLPKVDQSYVNTEGDILLLKELKIYEAKYSIDEPPEVELKDLPPHPEYAFLEGNDKLPVIIAKDLSNEEKTALITVFKSHKRAIAWKLSDIKGINPKFCTHKIIVEEDFKPVVQHQRRVNPKIHDVIKKEGGFTIVENVENELIPTRLVTGWRVCIDYRKLNKATHKEHFPLPFMDQMIERLAGNEYYYFPNGFSSYFKIPIYLKDQEKTTLMCPYGMFAYRRMPFGLCNAPGMFQRNSFQTCLFHLEKMLKRCEDTNLCLNWEKSYFMVKEGIVLSHKISKNRIEVDKAKVDVISKLPHPTTVKCIRSFLGHTVFYR
nr:reverse transcriptase domain-containing protein [Tanacetum cinerariifolium]